MGDNSQQEVRFEGAGVSPGIACSKIHVVRDDFDDITRYRIALSAYRTRAQTRPVLLPAVAGAGRWLRLRDLERLPFASAHRRLLQQLQQDLLL